ncbi:MAG: transposase, partial [Planctomycetota bacterium]
DLMAEWCSRLGVEVWAYCLMPNHVHLVAVPESEDGLRRAVGEAHRRYSRRINFREGWRGHLWQGRFASYPLDETYLMTAARYIERNPVRARLVGRAEEWAWSSVSAHVAGADDRLVKVKPLLDRVEDWSGFLSGDVDGDDVELLRRHERTGRPLGSASFVHRLEVALGRILHRRRPGPRRKDRNS